MSYGFKYLYFPKLCMIWKIPITIIFIAIASGLMYIALSFFVITLIYYAKSDGRDISRDKKAYKMYLALNRKGIKT